SAEGHAGRAGALMGLGRFDAALESAEAAGAPQGDARKARALVELGRVDEAAAAAAAVLKQNPYDDVALLAFAMTLAKQGRHQDAVGVANRLLTFYPDSAEALVARATSRHLLQDLTGALADLEAALTIDPDAVFVRGYALHLA